MLIFAGNGDYPDKNVRLVLEGLRAAYLPTSLIKNVFQVQQMKCKTFLNFFGMTGNEIEHEFVCCSGW